MTQSAEKDPRECGNYRLHGSAVTCPRCGFRGPVRSAYADTLTDADVRNLPLDERTYLALVAALGQDEDAAQDVLDAVMPFLRLAWEHGYSDGYSDEHGDPGGKSKSPNPFRAIPPEVQS